MKRLALLVWLFGATGVAAAKIDGIQNHEVQTIFWTAPCTETVALMDAAPPEDVPILTLVGVLAQQAMAWGHLLGFESAHPGIRGEHETVLMRLRTDCAATPDKTAIDILRGYTQE
ncbi:hypothetical protein [Tateyamaria sp. syn59]|uniref:hypothetical protein n=1 Tax=Tateyamaria sp. syn59 TaxID=2576942 RepID=UPI0011BF5972|nr:hypothetical protein [Tateyamaria sp. syn59]